MAAISPATPLPRPADRVPNILRALRERECGGRSKKIEESIEAQTVKNIAKNCFQSYAQQIGHPSAQIARSGCWAAVEDPNSVSLYDLLLGRKAWDCRAPEGKIRSIQVDNKGTVIRTDEALERMEQDVEIFQAGKKTGSIFRKDSSGDVFVHGEIFAIEREKAEVVDAKPEFSLCQYSHTGEPLRKIPLNWFPSWVNVDPNYCVIWSDLPCGGSPSLCVFDRKVGSHKTVDLVIPKDVNRVHSVALTGNRLVVGAGTAGEGGYVLIYNLLKKGDYMQEERKYLLREGKPEPLIANEQSAFYMKRISDRIATTEICSIDLSTGEERVFEEFILDRKAEGQLSLTGSLLSVCYSIGMNLQERRVFDTKTGDCLTKTKYQYHSRGTPMSARSGTVFVADFDSNPKQFYVENFYPTPDPEKPSPFNPRFQIRE